MEFNCERKQTIPEFAFASTVIERRPFYLHAVRSTLNVLVEAKYGQGPGMVLM